MIIEFVPIENEFSTKLVLVSKHNKRTLVSYRNLNYSMWAAIGKFIDNLETRPRNLVVIQYNSCTDSVRKIRFVSSKLQKGNN